MEITQHPGADSLELRLSGRIDATWGEHLGATIENAVRAGAHRIVLNFREVQYISSLGISVLFLQCRLLKSVNGSLTITHPNKICKTVLTTVGLNEILVSDVTEAAASAMPLSREKLKRGGATYDIYPQKTAQPLSCSMIGQPERLGSSGYGEAECRTLKFVNGSFGLGLGAFGEGFADCKGRFGEFLAAGGCAITLPTNEAHALPDYVVEQGGLVPQIEALYALVGKGDFSTMVRFDALAEGQGKIGLSELIDALIHISDAQIHGSGAGAVAFVVLAEAAGLVGASLRKSPAGLPLAHELPSVRDWLSFTTERTSEKSLCLLVGVAGRKMPDEAAAFLRPIKTESSKGERPMLAHVHAAVFPYRPVARGELPLGRTIADVLTSSTPNAVLHLMTDTRPFEGVGETDLVRGACWVGPLQSIARG
jgi:anti-anti-sigma factor